MRRCALQPADTRSGNFPRGHHDTGNPRVLRFDFPDYDKGLTQVTWDAWAKTFQDRDLVFLFQPHMKSGKQSNFFRLDSPEREDG